MSRVLERLAPDQVNEFVVGTRGALFRREVTASGWAFSFGVNDVFETGHGVPMLSWSGLVITVDGIAYDVHTKLPQGGGWEVPHELRDHRGQARPMAIDWRIPEDRIGLMQRQVNLWRRSPSSGRG